jgi:23S rRNA (cytidine1920-2'-O)/16S rRNA (cytidine1409-2'-O)-methyltransferase
VARARGPRRLVDEVARSLPEVGDPLAAILDGLVLVDRSTVTNPASVVRPGSVVTLARRDPLRGEAKLRFALSTFAVAVADRVCLDVGAAAGGFTRVLLEAGAARVYAVDAGHGQLVGSLRQDPRVVDLEATNLGALDRTRVPEPVAVFSVDLSYLSLADAVPQLDLVDVDVGADLVALVKPMFELGLGQPPAADDEPAHTEARRRAAAGVASAGWNVLAIADSPVTGAHGAREHLLHARRGAAGSAVVRRDVGEDPRDLIDDL